MPASPMLRRALVAAAAVLVTLISVLALTPQSANAGYALRLHKVKVSVRVAKRQVGDPYAYGATGPNAFDCSGLTEFAYGRAGLYLPRTAARQYHYVRHIPKSHIRRGDFVFFHNRSGSIYHVGIYLGRLHGRRMILHAPYSGRRVHRQAIWTRSWYAGTLRFRS